MKVNLVLSSIISGSLMLLAFLNLTTALGVNRKANQWFGVFCILWSTFWLDELIMPANQELPYLMYISVRFIQFLCPLIFFISVLFYTQPNFRFKTKDSWFLILPVLFLVLLISKPFLAARIYQGTYLFIFLLHALFYSIWAYLRVQKHQKNIELFSSSTEAINLNWITYIIYSFIGTSLLLIFLNILAPILELNVLLNIYFILVVYLVAYFQVQQKEIYPKGIKLDNVLDEEDNVVDEVNPGPKIKLISDHELEQLTLKVKTLIEREELFLDSELNLLKLAEHLKLSTHQLSYVLNNGFHENFFNVINRYRVERAKILLMDPKFNPYTIVAIGFEAGFNSKTSFNTTFKKMTGQTPTNFRESKN